jgi:hypothetical protein
LVIRESSVDTAWLVAVVVVTVPRTVVVAAAIASDPPDRCVAACDVGVRASVNLASLPSGTVVPVWPVGTQAMSSLPPAPAFGIAFAPAVAVAISSDPPF